MSVICQAPPQTVRPLRFRLPKGATDTHFHVFGPAAKFPYAPTATYTPAEALPVLAERLFKAVGVERAVLIQPSVYGNDNSLHLSAAAEMTLPTRVVVAIDSDAPDRVLEDLNARGACGVRRIIAQAGAQVSEDLRRLAEKLSRFGWHLQLLPGSGLLEGLEDVLARLPCPVVLDHMGMVVPQGGPSHPAFKALLRLLDGGNCYVKLSGYYRVSAEGPPYSALAELVRALLRAAPERLFWGSDWPHTAYAGPMPNLADLIDPLADWIPDEALRRRILVDNPAGFYRF